MIRGEPFATAGHLSFLQDSIPGSERPDRSSGRNGQVSQGDLRAYHYFHLDGKRPDISLTIAALKFCSRAKDLENGKKIHGYVVESREDRDVYVANALLAMYAKCGSLSEARKTFDGILQPTVVSWTCVISGYADCGEAGLALQLFQRMREENCLPNRVTFYAALKACSGLAEVEEEAKQADGRLVKLVSLEKGREIHAQAAKFGLDRDTFVASSLVDMYGKCGSMEDARRVFDKIQGCQDVVLWNSIILGYAECGDGCAALELFEDMQRKGFTPNARTFVAAVKALACLATPTEGILQAAQCDEKTFIRWCLVKARDIHAVIESSGHARNVFVASSLVDMYGKYGSLAEARRVFDNMRLHDAVSWNSMILGYAEAGEHEMALELYQRMQREGCEPNRVTFVAALKACCGLGALEVGRSIEAHAVDLKMEGDIVVATSLVDSYGKCGCVADAQRVFDAFPATKTKGLVTWNALIAGYSRQGDCKMVFEIFESMHRKRLQPDGITFLSVLAVCCHGGLVEEGKKYFQAMLPSYSVSPTAEHYGYMVELLGSANQLDVAVGMVRSMPVRPSLSIWITLLGACRKWRNVAIGELAFEEAVRLDEKNASAYVLIAAIYKEAGMGEESARAQAALHIL
ncbi:pentatricopeptide repeat-containing protein At1g11290, chloroplastic-like [Selaginella moellendorffii]|uniref:pentatricopeptide repeat-containing protein At1g11290, chloroplastic-like n=1 Tax=Selaginella moellendorffii TaxID=88036 RepID=UPI000D1CC9D0|nr:pentatricopeptide repeat-containing protein At1g11290, chloroplastic-like [Selaginella moellendorffii]|eukprot:XP_024531678.1 pentatricopeptide repeat-containing protein At1g11290, chloroplastic-like [Selaginella moellendorffii]